VLRNRGHRRHHRHPSVFEFCRSQVAEAILVAHFAEAERVEETQRSHRADLLRWVEWRWGRCGRPQCHRSRWGRSCRNSCEQGAPLPSARTPQRAQAKLLHPVLASEELRRDDAQSREHGHAAVVQLTVPHLRVVHAEAHWVTEIAHLLARVLRPDRELHEAREQEEHNDAAAAQRGGHCGEAARHCFEAREFDVVLRNRGHRRHHRHPPVL